MKEQREARDRTIAALKAEPRLAALRRSPGFDEHDRFLAITTPAFDIHVVELWLPLVLGASVEVVARDVASDGRALVRALRRRLPSAEPAASSPAAERTPCWDRQDVPAQRRAVAREAARCVSSASTQAISCSTLATIRHCSMTSIARGWLS